VGREFFLDLAARGVRFPIGTDLVLREEEDAEAILRDGRRLGQIVERAARRWRVPLAVPLMDLEHSTNAALPEYRALVEAVRYVAAETDLAACAMIIGPFSLTTRVINDPITAVALAGRGIAAGDEPLVREVETAIEEAERRVHTALGDYLDAGAETVIVCEPAASVSYFSPRQLRAGSPTFRRFVLDPNLRIKCRLDDAGVELIFHDCGELVNEMVAAFGHEIHPAMLSLGSSRKLWEDAAVIPSDVVLYGNLPTKSFYCDATMPVEAVKERAAELAARMRETGHPFILGSECDVLSVPGCEETIRRKVELAMAAP
jgi:hypothetical protein